MDPGDLVLAAGGAQRPVAWSIDAWPLLRGELRGSFTGGADSQRIGTFDAGGDKLDLRGIELALPMDALLRTLGAPSLLRERRRRGHAAGRPVSCTAPTRSTRRLRCCGRTPACPVRVPICGSRWATCARELSGQGREVPGTIQNTGGDVDLRGTLSAAANGSTRVDLEVKPRPGIARDRADAIATALGLIGSPDGQGGYRVAWAGRPR